MHEYALTKRIVEIINRTAEEHQAKRVNAALLMLGENAGIVPDSVQIYFDLFAKGTPAEGAKLQFRVEQAELRCSACGETFIKERYSIDCPCCGAMGLPTRMDNDCYVQNVELEV